MWYINNGDIMINFVICDDKKEFLCEIEKVIDKVMMKNKLAYKKVLFSEYNKDFVKLVYEKSIKIYILDIEVHNKSGLDFARQIRKIDTESIIIFITSHSSEGFNVLKGDFMCLSFISKLDNYKMHLSRSISSAIEMVNAKKSIKFCEKGILYSIPYSDVLYVYRTNIDRKCNVVGSSSSFKCSLKFSEFVNNLSFPFVKVNKSCFVNLERIKSVNYKTGIITFDTGFESLLYSPIYKENLNEFFN